jgi:hypothetical protein
VKVGEGRWVGKEEKQVKEPWTLLGFNITLPAVFVSVRKLIIHECTLI